MPLRILNIETGDDLRLEGKASSHGQRLLKREEFIDNASDRNVSFRRHDCMRT